MSIRRRILLTTVLGAAVLAAGAAAAAGPDHAATYERLKGLAGLWTGRMEDPIEGPPVAVRYEVVSHGRAVLEIQNPGESFEALNVYFLADGKLRAAHYSAAGNQPGFRLDRDSDAGLAVFELDGGSGFDPQRDGHVRGGDIRFVSPDRIEHRWFHHVGPKRLGVTHWFLAREAPEPPAEAPESGPEPPAP